MSDPKAWAGLATLIAVEIVLGIDNLVFIAILADKLPPNQRPRSIVCLFDRKLIVLIV
ncbi:hypothetical protein ACDY96_30300 [Rhizobium mongolense]|uniref:TerC family protein n=1 Tax=Rhizobium mongolense TaxID=57676 RepID=UPI003558FD3C